MYIELDGLETSSQHLSLKIQWEEIWKTVQLNSLWRPMVNHCYSHHTISEDIIDLCLFL